MLNRAVILAAGAGTRMRSPAPGAVLTVEQREAAESGLKGLVPFARPFLDYVVAALAEVGIDEICLVIGPHGRELGEYVANRQGGTPRLSTALQSRPLGTAHAVACAASFTGSRPFLVLNSDNYYPPAGLRELVELEGPGLLAVARDAVLADQRTNLSADRLASFAVVSTDGQGCVTRLDEKPERARYERLVDPVLLSVNCWRFDPSIHRHCAALERSPRGELELPAAAQAAIDAGERIRVVVTGGVLDLSTREDVGAVGRLLPGVAADD